MIRVAIVEDDLDYTNTLKEYIFKYEKESGKRFLVSNFKDGEDVIAPYTAEYDIILMDIEMEFMDGISTAEEIRKIDSEVVIIFITNMPQYAMKGYSVEALDYVLKPINYYAFSQRIDRALSRMDNRKKKYITINSRGAVKKIDISQIYYVEVQNHDLIYHTIDGEISSRGTIKGLEETLKSEGFFRCNKCYLINLEFVEKLQEGIVFVGKSQVQVSRTRKKELLDVLNNYMNEVSK